MRSMFGVLAIMVATTAYADCSFCTTIEGKGVAWDLSSLPQETFSISSSKGVRYYVTSPCNNVDVPFGVMCGEASPHSPGVQDELGGLILGLLNQENSTITPLDATGSSGFNLTVPGTGPPDTCGNTERRSSLYNFICDPNAEDGPTDVIEEVGCHYTFVWPHKAACGMPTSSCSTPIPPPPPPPPPTKKIHDCTPNWTPTWDMRNSTILYACNDSGFIDLEYALQYGQIVFDWSNAKDIWVNVKPMNDEELLTAQALQILERDPGVPGGQPKVSVYRNTIKALNWYTSVREKLDDPAYESWFIKFKDYKGPSSNNSYHVPACTYEKCSGFYHDQEQTPEYPHGDGSCAEECDCGKAPCGEYIFNTSFPLNESFADWYINSYMISNLTLLHKPMPIGLGWMDDSMTPTGPTEEDKNFRNDTGSSPEVMASLVRGYQDLIQRFQAAVMANDGFYWQMMRSEWPGVKGETDKDKCVASLKNFCQPDPPSFHYYNRYQVNSQDIIQNQTDYVAEFLLARGPYAVQGYGWLGCGGTGWPRPKLWDQDFGEPSAPCMQSSATTFTRDFSKATVSWDCEAGHGSIMMK